MNASLGTTKRRVLVVDDYEDAAEVTCLLLEFLGHEAHACHHGHEALELAGAVALDIAMIDIVLGDMSGYDVARALRARPGGHSLHLVALTGAGRPDDRTHAFEAGFDQHIIKPLDLATLTRILAQAIAPR